MGCLSLQFLKACTMRSSKIKVMTVDGTCLKYEAPSIVKEVLMDYPLHSLSDSETVRALADRARPLQSSLPLQSGHIYFLVPQAGRRSSHSACTNVNHNLSKSDCTCATLAHEKPSSSYAQTKLNAGLSQSDLPYMQKKETSPQSDLAYTHQVAKCSPPKQRKVSFATAPTVNSTETLKSCVQILPSPSEGVIRIKMVVPKRQLAYVLEEGGDCISMVEGLLSPLLEASRSNAAALSTRNDTSSDQLSWRPSLESIPESLLPIQ